MILRFFFPLLLAGLISCRPMAAEKLPLVLDRPMAPPAWALMERELLRLNSEACEAFASKYVDERGHLLHTPRWGTLDGPDDAIETFHNWTLLHALGASDSVLELFKKALEGHLHQYGQLRTTLTDLAREGAYHREFITMSDWFHTGEGMRGFMFQGLSEPGSPRLRERMKRFAGLYMNEDPEAPNYDPEHRIIRSIWNGSKGPMLRKATTYDWVGDPVPGRFHLLHSPFGRSRMLDLEEGLPQDAGSLRRIPRQPGRPSAQPGGHQSGPQRLHARSGAKIPGVGPGVRGCLEGENRGQRGQHPHQYRSGRRHRRGVRRQMVQGNLWMEFHHLRRGNRADCPSEHL